MICPPTYSVEILKETIPHGDLEYIKKVSATLRQEEELYSFINYSELLTLLTLRLSELSRLRIEKTAGKFNNYNFSEIVLQKSEYLQTGDT
jgi:hypothetical protein